MYFKNEHDLQLDLAKHLREVGYLTYTEIEIKGGRGGRADVIAIKPSYANKDCRIYEVKNNRSTFNNDSKYEKYFDVCHRMYIACPSGMIKKDELPPKIGLIVRNENGWHVVKAARRNNPKDFNIDFVLSLLYRGYEETLVQRRLRDKIIAEENFSLKKQAYKIGYEIARRLDKDRETEVEDWVIKCNELFKKYLDVDINYKRLPSLYELEYILSSISHLAKDIQYIKKIGEYLRSLDLPEEPEDKSIKWKYRKKLREEAMEFKKEA
ncbi:MmcB family DNA repair protein [Caloranaerobacter azorensis]|uniref:MmcB family DNA repair protein n=1 Tax=Caloranaerobacter azorensis TaxID=116090 RepID=A0A6P1YBJ6_9FIRM|nr:MmcB family DNA repair protein [Caloranaerobacter azorensis]QIB26083.1 MmcB family DNA repair protein [Caloranaerobacter azorensis]